MHIVLFIQNSSLIILHLFLFLFINFKLCITVMIIYFHWEKWELRGTEKKIFTIF